jgi:flagellar motor component MotA
MVRFLVGSLLSLGAFFLAFFIEGGDALSFFLFSPLLIVLLVPLFAVLAVWSLGELGGAWKAAFAKGLSDGEGKSAGALWDFYEKALYAAGIIGTLAGFIIILKNDDLRFQLFSIALMPLVEGILLGLVARILRARVEKNARSTR